jgi:hypothetical protein
LLRNIQQVQSRQNLPVSSSLTEFTLKNDKKKTIELVKTNGEITHAQNI